MRFVTSFVTGIVVGYMLHVKKDQSIDQLASGMVTFLENRAEGIRTRVTPNVSN